MRFALGSPSTNQFLKKWKEETGGNKYDEPMYCGFARVNVWDVKASTRLGKALKEVGFGKGYQKGLRLSNPGNHLEEKKKMIIKENEMISHLILILFFGLP